MNLDISGRTAVVTGGSKGIGLAVCSALAAEGARVVVGARHSTPALDQLRAAHDVLFHPVDLATPEGAADLIAAADDGRGIDLLVNNVGASYPAKDTLDHDDELWRRIFDITFFSAVWTSRAAVPLMPVDGTGAIVNIASVNARLPAGSIAPYSAAKAALVNMGKALAEDLATRRIRVNTVSPGPVRTPMWTDPGAFAELFADQAQVSAEEVMDRVLPETMAISLGRVAEPDEIADLVLFLLSARASWITGAEYVIDGGMLKSVA